MNRLVCVRLMAMLIPTALLIASALLFTTATCLPASAASPSVPPSASPSARAKRSITLLDWNIQVGSDSGMFRNQWKRRKQGVSMLLSREKPDIMCLQEALKEQIDFIRGQLPGYSYVGVGRDDGKHEGEHCAIFYSKRFEVLNQGTFWLSDTPDSCENTWDAIFKRICTWVRFRDLTTGNKFCVFNTHFPLIPEARDKAVKLLLQRRITECPRGSVILTGDFNCEPGSGPWRAIQTAGFTDAEFLLTKNAKRTKTFHTFGKPTSVLDAVFVTSQVKVRKHGINQQIFGNRYPSDHYPTIVELEFEKRN